MADHAARRGYRVGVLDLNLDEAQAIAEPIGGVALAADVSDPVQVEAAVERLGETPKVLINNAGILRTGPLLEHAVDDFRHVLKVNLLSVFIVSQIVARPHEGQRRRRHRQHGLHQRDQPLHLVRRLPPPPRRV